MHTLILFYSVFIYVLILKISFKERSYISALVFLPIFLKVWEII